MCFPGNVTLWEGGSVPVVSKCTVPHIGSGFGPAWTLVFLCCDCLKALNGPLTVDEVLEYIGFGKFQCMISFIAGLARVKT